jgi:hypothetical protein
VPAPPALPRSVRAHLGGRGRENQGCLTICSMEMRVSWLTSNMRSRRSLGVGRRGGVDKWRVVPMEPQRDRGKPPGAARGNSHSLESDCCLAKQAIAQRCAHCPHAAPAIAGARTCTRETAAIRRARCGGSPASWCGSAGSRCCRGLGQRGPARGWEGEYVSCHCVQNAALQIRGARDAPGTPPNHAAPRHCLPLLPVPEQHPPAVLT